jgi:CubicO group peptidase (beta-lactamase class C family)
MKSLSFLAIVSLISATSFASDRLQKMDSIFEKIDSIFAGLNSGSNSNGAPGAAVLVTEHGRVIYGRGFGVADLNSHAKITPATNFRLASVSKQFTAM